MTVETFFANFGHLADAPNGVIKLRELILQLAVQGKLVPQDPNDESASYLIQTVQVGDASLLVGETAPFTLPASWLWVRLGGISVIERGGSPRPIKDFITDDPDGLNWIKIGDTDIGGKYISTTKEKIRREGLKKTRMVYPGDFLLTNSMSFGRPYITKIEGCIHDGWLRIHPPEILDKDYLYNLLSSPYVFAFFKGAAAGAVVSNLNTDKVRELPIPIPPLEEQKRIVAKVDQLMALCDELEARQQKQQQGRVRLNNAALEALLTAREPDEFADHWQRISTNFDLLYDHPETIAKLRAAILQLAVQGKLVPQDPNDEPASVLLERIKAEKERLVKLGEIRKTKPLAQASENEASFCLPSGWGVERFGNLTNIVGGVTKGRKLAGRKAAFFPYLRVANVQRWFVDLDVMKEIEIPVEELEKYALKTGDLLITEGGDWDKVGRTAVWDGQIENCLHQNHVFRARLFEGKLSRDWLVLAINSPVGREYFANSSKQTTNLASINMTQLKHFPMPVPPAAEQKRIVAKVDQLMDLCDELEVKLNRAQQHSEKLMEATVRKLLVA